MKLQRQIDELTSRQASAWIETLKTGGAGERTAFVAWLKESRRHVDEFLAMVAIDRELGHIDAAREHDLQTLLTKITPHAMPVTALHIQTRPNPRAISARRRWMFGIAAGLAAVCAFM